jgi:chromatin remodeling complex protein RSC6
MMTNKISKKKEKKKTMTKKKAFGGYEVSFKGRKETMEQVFGTKRIPPSAMTKKLWQYVKTKNLGGK